MGKIHLVTDSTSDIPASVRESLGIEIVPLKVHFGDRTYQDGVTIQSDEFYEKLVRSSEFPTTSQPSPVDFVDVYRRILKNPEAEIVSVHLASALSGTYQSAMLAKSLLEENQERISVVDSRTTSYGLGSLVVAGAQAAEQGECREDIVRLMERKRKNMRLYFILDTLDYLYKGGRIGKASALFGSLLNIKPILTIDDDGEVSPVDKMRGQKKAQQRMVELFKRDFDGRDIVVAIAYAQSDAVALELSAMVKEQFHVKEEVQTALGPVIGAHVGPGAAAVFVSPFDDD